MAEPGEWSRAASPQLQPGRPWESKSGTLLFMVCALTYPWETANQDFCVKWWLRHILLYVKYITSVTAWQFSFKNDCCTVWPFQESESVAEPSLNAAPQFLWLMGVSMEEQSLNLYSCLQNSCQLRDGGKGKVNFTINLLCSWGRNWGQQTLVCGPDTPITLIFKNKVLLQHSHAHSFVYYLWPLSHYSSRTE